MNGDTPRNLGPTNRRWTRRASGGKAGASWGLG
jgi:hypothetical protein